MKRLILALLILCLWVFPEQEKQETPWQDSFEEEDFYIYRDSEKVDLFSTINKDFLAIRFADQVNQAQIQQVISGYKLNEMVDLLIDENFRVFAITQTFEIEPYKGYSKENDKFLGVINDILKEESVEFVSPIFQYGRNLQVLTGEVIIKFNRKKKINEGIISAWQNKRGLERVDYREEEKELILRAKVTNNSGRNVFQIIHELHPMFGKPAVETIKTSWITEVSPDFTIIQNPIELRSDIYLLENPEAYAGHTVYSKYRYVLTIEYDLSHFKERDIQIHLNELKLSSYTLEAWIPINFENQTKIKPQFFEFYGKEKIKQPKKENKKFVQEVEYVFSISQAGTWFLPPLKIIYSFVNPITRVKETREMVSDPIFIEVGSILPRDAQNVNNPVGPSGKIEKPKIRPSVFGSLAIGCWIVAACFFLLLAGLTFIKLAKSMNKPKVSAEKSPREKWQEFGEELLKTTNSRREFSTRLVHQFKAILGLTSSTIAEIDDERIKDFLKKTDNYIHGPKDREISRDQAKKLLNKAEELLFGERNGN